MIDNILLYILIGDIARTLREYEDRIKYFKLARYVADYLDKPLLVVGEPKGKHPYGDVTIDINPTEPGVIRMDVLEVDKYFPYKYFGCVYISHVLEHLPPDKLGIAIKKLSYVSHCIVALYPKLGKVILGLIHPEHYIGTLVKLWKLSPSGILIIFDKKGEKAICKTLKSVKI